MKGIHEDTAYADTRALSEVTNFGCNKNPRGIQGSSQVMVPYKKN